MQINLSDDRKRLLISGGTAVLIHIVILIIAGLNPAQYDTENDFGPVSVQISLERPIEKPKEPEPVEAFNADDAPEAEIVEAAPERVPVQPEPDAAAAKPAVETEPVVKAVEDDYDPVEAIRSRSSGSSGGVNPWAAFGDDPTPPVTERSNSTASSSVETVKDQIFAQSDSSEVDDSSAEIRIVDQNQLTELDNYLSGANDSSSNDGAAAGVVQDDKTVNGSISGDSHNIKFTDPSLSRELLKWSPPEIPKSVQTAGISRYTIVIAFDIDSDGVTSRFELFKTSGNSQIDAAVQTALRKWVFKESQSEQKNVRATLTYVIEIK